ncbi:MAG TPA: DNA polymerase III subunit delta [Thermodesulfobacteriota bacterium]|nr:DNA polymerase III subunit delta [Thermodesulfobacteriota bacterium]
MKKRASDRLTYSELRAGLSGNEISPVYIFSGSQTYLMDQTVAELKKTVLGASGDFNFSLYYGDSAGAKDIVDTAKTYPMLSKMRLIVVKNAERLPAGELKLIDSYFSSPSPFTCLVLVFGEGKKPVLDNKSQVVFVDFDLDTKDVYESIKGDAERLGCRITKDAASMLVSLVGENLQDIHTELEKLALFVREQNKIGVGEVERFTQKTQFEDVFQLVNAIAAKDKKKALSVLLELESTKEEPLAILNRIGWRIRQIWKAKELIDRKAPQDVMLKELKVSKGALYYIQQEAKSFSYNDIKRISNALCESDRMLKTSYIPKNIALTRLVLELCQK